MDADERLRQWQDFTPPASVRVSHPWIARYFPSAILYHENGPSGSNDISTTHREVYSLDDVGKCSREGGGDDDVSFCIGNGGAGYTGILGVLAEGFLARHRDEFPGSRIGWIAFTYEPHNEAVAVAEGWAGRVGLAFWDHFILVGPKANPARLERGVRCHEALRLIAEARAPFHTRGDGSATFFRERRLWQAAGVAVEGDSGGDDDDASTRPWLQTFALAPYQALQRAHEHDAYLLTDRATFLTAKRDRAIPDTAVYVEGGEELLNPCSALVNVHAGDGPRQRQARAFADFLLSDEAQGVIREFGRDWEPATSPLFTVSDQAEFEAKELLCGRQL